MSLARLFRVLCEKRRLDKALRERKFIRKLRREAALRGKVTEHLNRVRRQRQTWGQV